MSLIASLPISPSFAAQNGQILTCSVPEYVSINIYFATGIVTEQQPHLNGLVESCKTLILHNSL